MTRAGRTSGSDGRRDDLAAGDPDVADLAIDAVGRVVDGPAGDLEIIRAHRVARRPGSRPRPCPGRGDPHGRASDRRRTAPGDRETQARQLARDQPEEERPEPAGPPEGREQSGRFRPEESDRAPAHLGPGLAAARPEDQDACRRSCRTRRRRRTSRRSATSPRRIDAPIASPAVAVDQDRAVGHAALAARIGRPDVIAGRAGDVDQAALHLARRPSRRHCPRPGSSRRSSRRPRWRPASPWTWISPPVIPRPM